MLPRLQSADQASLLGQREMLLRGGNGDEQRGTVDLFGRAASIGALADLGLSRLPNADAQLQASTALSIPSTCLKCSGKGDTV